MLLRKIEISNYRQLSHIVLDFESDLTVLAGPNNSGKTTLISVLKGIFNDKKMNLSYSDIPSHLSALWLSKVYPSFEAVMLANSKETGIAEIIKVILQMKKFFRNTE